MDEEQDEESSDKQKEDDNYGGFAFLQGTIVCSNRDKAAMPKIRILLDSQSKQILKLYCNSGKVSVTQKGNLRGYGTVCYYPVGIANIFPYTVYRKSTSSPMTELMEPGLQYTKWTIPAMYLNLPRGGYPFLILSATLF